MTCPEQVHLSRADGEALRTRLAGDTLTATDRRVLDLVLQWYFWLLFALQEATFSLWVWAMPQRQPFHLPWRGATVPTRKARDRPGHGLSYPAAKHPCG